MFSKDVHERASREVFDEISERISRVVSKENDRFFLEQSILDVLKESLVIFYGGNLKPVSEGFSKETHVAILEVINFLKQFPYNFVTEFIVEFILESL